MSKWLTEWTNKNVDKCNLLKIHWGTSIYRQCDSSSFTRRIFNVSTPNPSFLFLITLWVRIPLKQKKIYYVTLVNEGCMSPFKSTVFMFESLQVTCSLYLSSTLPRLCQHKVKELHLSWTEEKVVWSWLLRRAGWCFVQLNGSSEWVFLTNVCVWLKWKHGVELDD